MSEYYEVVDNNRTYSEANLFFKIHEEGLTRHSIHLPSRANGQEEEESAESVDLLARRLI